eukprot:507499-Ditylum_brightwellii.AAC.1
MEGLIHEMISMYRKDGISPTESWVRELLSFPYQITQTSYDNYLGLVQILIGRAYTEPWDIVHKTLVLFAAKANNTRVQCNSLYMVVLIHCMMFCGSKTDKWVTTSIILNCLKVLEKLQQDVKDFKSPTLSGGEEVDKTLKLLHNDDQRWQACQMAQQRTESLEW